MQYLTVVLLFLLGACSAPTTQAKHADGQRHPVPGAVRATVVVPAEAEIVAPTTWMWPSKDGPILLTVRRQPEPNEGANPFLDREIKKLQAGGEIGIAGDRRVPLGDLEGRLIEATTLLKEETPTALWQLVCVAEEGMYTVTVAGPLLAMQERREKLQGFLKSLRVGLPEEVPVKHEAVVELVEPPTPTGK